MQIYVFVYVCRHACMYVNACNCMYACMYKYVCLAHLDVFVYLYVCLCLSKGGRKGGRGIGRASHHGFARMQPCSQRGGKGALGN